MQIRSAEQAIGEVRTSGSPVPPDQPDDQEPCARVPKVVPHPHAGLTQAEIREIVNSRRDYGDQNI